MTKKITIGALIAFLVLIAIICISGSFYTVAENEYACTVRFSKIINTVDEPGIHFKVPFVDSIRTYPKTTLFYDIPTSEVYTTDKKAMNVDSYVLWTIDDPLIFFQTLGGIPMAESRLDDITYNAFKTKMGTLEQDDIINYNSASERNEIYESIKLDVQDKVKDYGISVVDVKLKRLDLPESNEQAVYTRMISERTKEAEELLAIGEAEATKIRSEIDKEVAIMISDAKANAEQLVAKGEAEYMRILAEAYNTPEKRRFYEFRLSLETLRATLTGEHKTVILGRDSDLAKLLLGLDAEAQNDN